MCYSCGSLPGRLSSQVIALKPKWLVIISYVCMQIHCRVCNRQHERRRKKKHLLCLHKATPLTHGFLCDFCISGVSPPQLAAPTTRRGSFHVVSHPSTVTCAAGVGGRGTHYGAGCRRWRSGRVLGAWHRALSAMRPQGNCWCACTTSTGYQLEGSCTQPMLASVLYRVKDPSTI